MENSLPRETPAGLGRTRQPTAGSAPGAVPGARPAAAATASVRGRLRPDWGRGRYALRRLPPPGDLTHVVERFWITEWDLRGRSGHTVEVLPHPAVNLVFTGGTAAFHGPGVRLFRYPLHGRGRVFGVKLRPGAGFPLCRVPLHRLTDAELPLAGVVGPHAEAVAARLPAAPPGEAGDREQAALAAGLLRGHPSVRAPDPNSALVDGIVQRLLFGPRTLRVRDAAESAGLSVRGLQRLFARYVGVPPKQVLLRYRLHEAAERIAAGPVGDWAAFAAHMGYFDQAHFVRDFTRAVGVSPTGYARRCARDRASGATPG